MRSTTNRAFKFISLLTISVMFISSGCQSQEPPETTEETRIVVPMELSDKTPEGTFAIVTTEPDITELVTPEPTPTPEYIEPEFDETWYNGFVDPRSIRAQIVENPNDITVLVNKYYALPEDYVPEDLVPCSHSFDQQLRADAAAAWEQLYTDCLAETGEGITLVSGYRDNWTQQYLFDRSRDKNGLAFACKKNAIPGRSEHQLGLAMDITPAGHDNIMDFFDETTTGKWICENGHKYGLIHRYKEEYVYETGYGVEGWHFRYVGVDLATYLYENHMSLEAYYGKQQVVPWDE